MAADKNYAFEAFFFFISAAEATAAAHTKTMGMNTKRLSARLWAPPVITFLKASAAVNLEESVEFISEGPKFPQMKEKLIAAITSAAGTAYLT